MFTANTNFATARELLIQAASELFGANSSQVINTTNAWYAAGVGEEWRPDASYIYGSSFACVSESTVFVDTLPTGYSVDHFSGSSNIYIQPQVTGNNIGNYCRVEMINQYGMGSGYLDIVFSTPGDNLDTLRHLLFVGPPIIAQITGDTQICPPGEAFYNADVFGATQFYWSYPQGSYPIDGNTNEDLYLSFDETFDPNGMALSLQATNVCGWTNEEYMVERLYDCYLKGFSISPNPASESIKITITNSKIVRDPVIMLTDNPDDGTAYNIRIMTSSGLVISTVKRTGTTFSIPVNNLKDGTYLVELSDGKTVYRKQLIISH